MPPPELAYLKPEIQDSRSKHKTPGVAKEIQDTMSKAELQLLRQGMTSTYINSIAELLDLTEFKAQS